MSGVSDQRGRELLVSPRFELVPVKGVEAEIDHLPEGAKVTVTCSRTRGIDATLALTELLRSRDFAVVPHLSARLVTDRDHAQRIVERLAALQTSEIFVIGGDVARPAGPYHSASSLLADLAELGFEGAAGVAGYPEPHPFIETGALWQALRDKQPFASYVVTQICFDAARIVAWARELGRRGIDLPVLIGFPGVVDRMKLMRVALRIGVGDSTRYLTKHANLISRLVRPGGYNPDELLQGVAPYVDDAGSNIAGYHINTFNEVQSTERWRRRSVESSRRSGSTAVQT